LKINKKVKAMRKRNIRLAVSIVIIVLSIGSITLADGNSAEHDDHDISFSVFTLIKVLGICALISLALTFLTGLFRKRLGRNFLRIHRVLASLTVLLALSHGIIHTGKA
jgi:DMSO/TMAO reductase YedYZ heme-binding membrane subunit